MISKLQSTTEELIEQHNHLENTDIESIVIPDDYEAKKNADEPILPQMPNLFKVTRLTGLDHDSKTIVLENQPNMIPISVCGDGCSVNMTSPLTKCSSHAANILVTLRCKENNQTLITNTKLLRKDLGERNRFIEEMQSGNSGMIGR